jgi:hypothetical protein
MKESPRRRWPVLLVLIGALLFVMIWWKVPPALYRKYPGTDDGRLKAIADTRTALLAGLVGVGALLTFWLNSRVYRVTSETLHVTEQGQITERFTKSIEQLGSNKLDVRLGGIYALERIAKDSERDRATVLEVLSAFVREHGDPAKSDSEPSMAKVLSDLLESDRAVAGELGRDVEQSNKKPYPTNDVRVA